MEKSIVVNVINLVSGGPTLLAQNFVTKGPQEPVSKPCCTQRHVFVNMVPGDFPQNMVNSFFDDDEYYPDFDRPPSWGIVLL